MSSRSIFLILFVTAFVISIVADQELVFGSGEYVGSKEGDCYHKSNCRYAKNIKDENLIVFSDECDAVNRGYRPCKVCDPPECQPVSQETSEQQTSPLPEPKTTITPKTTATQTTMQKKTTKTEVTPTPESTSKTTSSDGGSLIVPAVTILGLAGVGAYILKRRSSQAKSSIAGSEA